ncbi:hypothetical protein [uncultured Halorubrum sp.]|jgi:hypothetical protein|uniref:hypothetical protein n=1 Tax=uncultured Halorubrum sp. TaxID=399555 RepID=UPI0026023C80|nr:hypothetical protein [uncultured Halorubrum sp.]
MDLETAETAADPDELRDRLPPAPGEWTRTADTTGTVEYRLPSDESPCTAAKLTVRPELFTERAVRLDKTVDCSSVGTDRFDTVEDVVAVVERELAHVLRGLDDAPEGEAAAPADS